MREKLWLSIGGMHCGACVRRATETLQGLTGVQLVSVEVGSAQMTFDSEEITPEKIAAAINGIGFQVYVEK